MKDIKTHVNEVLPTGWYITNLGNECMIKTGRKDVNEGNPRGTYPFFTCSRNHTYSDTYSFDTEAILIAGNGDVGTLHYYKGKFEAYQRTYVLDKIKVDSFYIYQYLSKYLIPTLLKQRVGTSIPYIKLNNLTRFEVKLPKFSTEQQKIAEILTKVDEAIDVTEKIIKKNEGIKKGLMQDLFSRGVDEKGNLRSEKTHKFKDSELGRIPNEWMIESLDDLCNINSEQISKRVNNVSINYIDIDSIKDFKIKSTKVFRLNNAPSRARRIVRNNDIIVSTVRPYLKAFSYITKQYHKYICSTGFSVLRVKNRVSCNSHYLYYCVLNDNIFLHQILPLIIGSNYPAINSTDLVDIKIPKPKLAEQQKISSIFSSIDTKIQKEKQELSKLKKIKEGLMQDLLTGKVRVNHLIQNN